jgi:hypothetical protein
MRVRSRAVQWAGWSAPLDAGRGDRSGRERRPTTRSSIGNALVLSVTTVEEHKTGIAKRLRLEGRVAPLE